MFKENNFVFLFPSGVEIKQISRAHGMSVPANSTREFYSSQTVHKLYAKTAYYLFVYSVKFVGSKFPVLENEAID